jgi:hypothetical protein
MWIPPVISLCPGELEKARRAGDSSEQRDREERGKRREEDTTVAMSALKFCGKW